MARYPGSDMEQVSVSLREETIEVAESLQKNSLENPELWDMSRSEAIRELVQHGIENLSENPDLERLIDAGALEAYQRQKRHEERRREAEKWDLIGGWRGRVSNRIDHRLAGDEPYPPEMMERLAESYFGDIADLCDDPDELQRHRDWLDRKIERYRNAYSVKKLAPADTFRDRDEKVDTGADLWLLSQTPDETLADIVGAIESEHSDADALATKLANEWGVSEESVWTLLDMLSPEVENTRQILIGTAGREIGSLINPDRTDLIEPEIPVRELASSDQAKPEPETPENPELSPDTPTDPEQDYQGVSDGGIVVSDSVAPANSERDHDPDEDLIEQATDLLQDPDTAASTIPTRLPAPENQAKTAVKRASERLREVDQ